MEDGIWRHDDLVLNENKTSTTIAPAAPPVTSPDPPARGGLCGYVIGPGAVFCDRPARAGSSYCAWHRALCAVAPASPAFADLAAAQLAAAADDIPPELGWLAAPPEFFDEGDDDRLAGLDLPPQPIAGAE